MHLFDKKKHRNKIVFEKKWRNNKLFLAFTNVVQIRIVQLHFIEKILWQVISKRQLGLKKKKIFVSNLDLNAATLQHIFVALISKKDRQNCKLGSQHTCFGRNSLEELMQLKHFGAQLMVCRKYDDKYIPYLKI